MVRWFACSLGCFILLNLTGDLFAPGFDANHWWIDVRVLPTLLGDALLLACAAGLLAIGFAPSIAARHRRWVAAMILPATGLAVLNAMEFWRLLSQQRIDAGVPVPLSALFAAALLLVLHRNRAATVHHKRSRSMLLAASAIVFCAVAFPLALMFFFGKTDYRRKADCIVVFGARAYSDGRPSQALYDRVRTGCELYHAGLAPTLVFSGGPGDGDVHETECMRRVALRLGVPDDRIIVDTAGLNTQATARNTLSILERMHIHRVLAVSHFYHLPRVKMAYQRLGLEVYTVPAHEPYTLTKMPLLIAREVAALWAYYLRPLA